MERKIIYVGDHTILTELIYGPKIFLDTRDTSVAQSIIWYGHWEPGVTNVFRALVKPGMVVLDIGANCGYYSLLAAQAVGPSGRVHCIEPNPLLHKNLTRSFLFNGYNHVKLHKVAFSDNEEEITLYVPGEFSGGGSIYEIPSSYTDHGEVKTVKVPAVNFATHFSHLKANVIIIDIQGAEPVLQDGLLKITENSGNVDILMEYAPILIRQRFNPESFLERLASYHFSFTIIEENGKLKPVSFNQLLSTSKELDRSAGFIDLWLSRRI